MANKKKKPKKPQLQRVKSQNTKLFKKKNLKQRNLLNYMGKALKKKQANQQKKSKMKMQS